MQFLLHYSQQEESNPNQFATLSDSEDGYLWTKRQKWTSLLLLFGHNELFDFLVHFILDILAPKNILQHSGFSKEITWRLNSDFFSLYFQLCNYYYIWSQNLTSRYTNGWKGISWWNIFQQVSCSLQLHSFSQTIFFSLSISMSREI